MHFFFFLNVRIYYKSVNFLKLLFLLFFLKHDCGGEESLDLENTLWANCVLASGTALGAVVYTGCETRSVMNNSQPRSKVGLLDMEINQLTKVSLIFYLIASF